MDYVASPLTGITGWPQTGNWPHGVIDGVYSQGHNVVLVVSGERVHHADVYRERCRRRRAGPRR